MRMNMALVRANYEDLSKGIHKTEKFLMRFLSTSLLIENYSQKKPGNAHSVC